MRLKKQFAERFNALQMNINDHLAKEFTEDDLMSFLLTLSEKWYNGEI